MADARDPADQALLDRLRHERDPVPDSPIRTTYRKERRP